MSNPDDYDELKDKYLRVLAEMDNFRKRTLRDVEAARGQATAATLLALLPIVDDLERALQASAGGPMDSEGLRAIAAKTKAVLATLDVREFETVGRPFVAGMMEAIAMVPSGRELQSGEVVAEISRGYQIGDKLLRPAQVAVAGDKT